ncbi:helix-turn-helix domain-containing protein [Clostridium sp. 1001275B_160808_H3]|uniref:helix-turn-helix domain-containing protein n=1 Tax=Clostridium sp. 1001275B_160808_H3 TaxID=2787110 RepID=UPI00189819D1|nr:helix-turn-helix domain-containing protein [Clostridium sp. 1001275B_160808_H3]
MSDLVGVRWGDLKKETKEFLLMNSTIWDNVKEGECIYDLTEDLAISGYVKCISKDKGDYEYIIDDDAIIYDPSEGVILETKEKVKFVVDEVMTVNEAAEIWGKTEGAIRAAIKAKKFIPGVDYRKAGRITLITKEAMERVYGEGIWHKE